MWLAKFFMPFIVFLLTLQVGRSFGWILGFGPFIYDPIENFNNVQERNTRTGLGCMEVMNNLANYNVICNGNDAVSTTMNHNDKKYLESFCENLKTGNGTMTINSESFNPISDFGDENTSITPLTKCVFKSLWSLGNSKSNNSHQLFKDSEVFNDIGWPEDKQLLQYYFSLIWYFQSKNLKLGAFQPVSYRKNMQETLDDYMKTFIREWENDKKNKTEKSILSFPRLTVIPIIQDKNAKLSKEKYDEFNICFGTENFKKLVENPGRRLIKIESRVYDFIYYLDSVLFEKGNDYVHVTNNTICLTNNEQCRDLSFDELQNYKISMLSFRYEGRS